MLKYLTSLFCLFSMCTAMASALDCVQSVDFGIGWRRDNLKWEVSDITDSCVDAEAFSNIHFKKIDMYMVHGKAKWAGSEFYIRLGADYGLSDKGRAEEHFGIDSFWFGPSPWEIVVDNPVKRRSEFYDFSGAVGYPYTLCQCRLMIAPLIGFSYHRQRIRTKDDHHDSSFSSDFSLSSSNPFFPGESSPVFDDSSGPFWSSSSSSGSPDFNPFSDHSEGIASFLGFSAHTRTSVYRFTWYGPFVGIDLAYGLDEIWTIFTELEWHFLCHCHRKRHSNTAVDFVDDYHKKGNAFGFNGSLGTTFLIGNNWYSTIAVDYKWWRSNTDDDELCWNSIGINISLGYIF